MDLALPLRLPTPPYGIAYGGLMAYLWAIFYSTFYILALTGSTPFDNNPEHHALVRGA